MNLLELSKRRFSVRDYNETPLSQDKLNYILEVGRYAPSAVNFQPWKIYVAESTDALNKLHQCYTREWFCKAPTALLICADHTKSWKRPYDLKDHADIDIAILTQNLCLAAAEVEVGCCWICNFNPSLCRSLFDLPEHLEPLVILALGNSPSFPTAKPIEKKRVRMDELIEKI